MVRPELLAPVGSWDALLAALTNGADAVYLGGKQFNARANAANFDEVQMERAVKVAHRFGARVFVTVNTLLREDELRGMGPYVRNLYDVGVDALIIQDLGLLQNLRQLVPNMELHASTQMTVHNTAAAKLLKEMGIRRVVIARELSYEQVKAIKDNAGVEIESFVHGALCFAYSGQCLMSSIIGGRSGNRGRCAQPCRLPYDLQQEERTINSPASRYVLSPRDLNHIRYLKQWVDAGISALKIEGRMKRPEYVATVVRAYRQALDKAILGESNGGANPHTEKELVSAFNRRFTSGLAFASKGSELMSSDRPDNRGLDVGKVVASGSGGRRVKVLLDAPIHGDDQLELWSPGRERIAIAEVPQGDSGQTVWLNVEKPAQGDERLYRLADASLWRRAQASYQDWEQVADQHRHPLSLSIVVAEGQPVVVEGHSRDGAHARVASDRPAETAISRPINKDAITQAFAKLTDTPFSLGEVDIQIVGEPTVSVSILNGLRRRLVEQLVRGNERPALGETWEKNWPIAVTKVARPVRQLCLAVTVGEVDAALAAMKSQPDILIFGGESYRRVPELGDYARMAERARQSHIDMIVALPRITTDGQLAALEPILKEALRLHVPVMAANLGQYHLITRNYPDLQLYLHWALNLFNPWAVSTLLGAQVGGVMPSPELTLHQLGDLSDVGNYHVGALVGGRIPLMVSEHCLRKNAGADCQKCPQDAFMLKDRYGVSFPVARDQYCRSHILNSHDLCLVEHIPAMAKTGIDHLVVEGRSYAPDTLREVIGIWKQALLDYQGGPSRWKERGQHYRVRLEEYSSGGITKGHFFRGVE